MKLRNLITLLALIIIVVTGCKKNESATSTPPKKDSTVVPARLPNNTYPLSFHYTGQVIETAKAPNQCPPINDSENCASYLIIVSYENPDSIVVWCPYSLNFHYIPTLIYGAFARNAKDVYNFFPYQFRLVNDSLLISWNFTCMDGNIVGSFKGKRS